MNSVITIEIQTYEQRRRRGSAAGQVDQHPHPRAVLVAGKQRGYFDAGGQAVECSGARLDVEAQVGRRARRAAIDLRGEEPQQLGPAPREPRIRILHRFSGCRRQRIGQAIRWDAGFIVVNLKRLWCCHSQYIPCQLSSGVTFSPRSQACRYSYGRIVPRRLRQSSGVPGGEMPKCRCGVILGPTGITGIAGQAQQLPGLNPDAGRYARGDLG